MRAGIVGIERSIEKKQKETDQQVSQAFKDLDALIDKVSLQAVYTCMCMCVCVHVHTYMYL